MAKKVRAKAKPKQQQQTRLQDKAVRPAALSNDSIVAQTQSIFDRFWMLKQRLDQQIFALPFWEATWFHCLIIVGFFSFLFGKITGNLGIEGDDVFMVAPQQLDHHLPLTPYLEVMSRRGYLILTYRAVTELFVRNPIAVHIFYLTMYIVSAVLLYFVARKILSPFGSLLAALFYAAYTGKFEVIPLINGGMYIIVMMVFLISLWLALNKKIPLWLSATIITLINWIAVHWYEIILVAAPLYPAITILYRKFHKQKIFTWDLAATFLPLVMGLSHMYLLSQRAASAGQPIWQRNPNLNYHSHIALIKQAIATFFYGLDTTLGPRHLEMVKYNVVSFKRYLFTQDAYFAIVFIIILSLLGLLLYRFLLGPKSDETGKAQLTKLDYVLIIIVCAYLVLFGPIESFWIITDFVPPRFTFMGSVGAGIAMGALYDVRKFFGSIKWLAVVFVFIILLEACAFTSIMQQYQTTEVFDYHIRDQLLAFHTHPQTHDTVFISFPRDVRMIRFWREAPSKIQNGGIFMQLLIDAHLAYENDKIPWETRLTYIPHERDNYFDQRTDYLLTYYPDWKNQPNHVFPYFVDGKYRVFGIHSITIVDSNNQPLDSITFPAFDQTPKDKLIDLSAPNVGINDPMITETRTITMVGAKPDKTLVITGEKFPNDPPFTAQLKDGKTILAEKSVSEVGKFTWEIPLQNAPQDTQTLTVTNRQDMVNGARALWKVDTISLQANSQ